ncbi:hypothetical protein [Alistipes sp. ZOR0009]|uniref:hypothetical protein n=1 Tax=Alistipes sp. ZOR0009 TaxID=1339253 RepID=UPI000A4B9EA0|nr:hypothetical protein [Alistipes sp. ZOR0009]
MEQESEVSLPTDDLFEPTKDILLPKKEKFGGKESSIETNSLTAASQPAPVMPEKGIE